MGKISISISIIAQHKMAAVSYTHLDVYKRQDRKRYEELAEMYFDKYPNLIESREERCV